MFKPLPGVDLNEEMAATIPFLADPDQLAALVVLANYGREHDENVIVRYAAGCQAIGIFSSKQITAQKQRAVIGLTDMTVRKYFTKHIDDHLMSFSVPLRMFKEMEENIAESFLGKEVWVDFFKGKEDNNGHQ